MPLHKVNVNIESDAMFAILIETVIEQLTAHLRNSSTHWIEYQKLSSIETFENVS